MINSPKRIDMIRLDFFTWAAIILFALSTANANTNHILKPEGGGAMCKIQQYLSSIPQDCKPGEACIYLDFLVAEHGELYNIDFMVTEDGKVTVLSVEFEEEYYKVNNYSSHLVKRVETPLALIYA